MKKKENIFQLGHILSSLLMILSLLWLTVSIPIVIDARQAQKEFAHEKYSCDANPLAGTTEEKNESNVNTLSEFLHDSKNDAVHPVVRLCYEKCHSSDLYFAYHPELISPPPEA